MTAQRPAPRLPAAISIGLPRLIAARAHVAEMVGKNPAYLPIFERLDQEVELAEAAQLNDPVYRARLLAEKRRSQG